MNVREDDNDLNVEASYALDENVGSIEMDSFFCYSHLVGMCEAHLELKKKQTKMYGSV